MNMDTRHVRRILFFLDPTRDCAPLLLVGIFAQTVLLFGWQLRARAPHAHRTHVGRTYYAFSRTSRLQPRACCGSCDTSSTIATPRASHALRVTRILLRDIGSLSQPGDVFIFTAVVWTRTRYIYATIQHATYAVTTRTAYYRIIKG